MKPPADAVATKNASIEIDASPAAVYRLVSDLPRMGEWSPEAVGGEWMNDASGAAGDWFLGHNRAGEREWSRECEIAVAEPGREFTFVVGGVDANCTTWSYELEPVASGGTVLTERWWFVNLTPALQAATPEQLAARIDSTQGAIEATLAAIKATAEASTTAAATRAHHSGDAQLYRYDESRTKHRTPEHPVRPGVEVLSLAFNADPLEHMAWMRGNAPVYWDDITGLWAITKHEHISHVEANWETFCSSLGSRPNSAVPSMINADPPDHTRRRRIVSSGFTPRRVADHEAFLRSTVTDLIDGVIDAGRCDFVEDVAKPIPLRMIAKLMGLPLADEAKLLHWSDIFATGGEAVMHQVEVAVLEWVEYIVEEMKTRTDPDADDLISLLIHTDGEPLSTEDLIYETMLILVGGDETTRHVMSGGLEALLGHPDQLAALQADRSLLPGAIEEMLRWVTPVRNMNRTATRDIELGGQQILAGDRLLLLYLSGNRDEAVFDRAHEFDITRQSNRHMAFGANGRHFCLGAQLARLELRVLFEEVLDRLPDLALDTLGITQPERAGNFVLGIEHLPVHWDLASLS